MEWGHLFYFFLFFHFLWLLLLLCVHKAVEEEWQCNTQRGSKVSMENLCLVECVLSEKNRWEENSNRGKSSNGPCVSILQLDFPPCAMALSNTIFVNMWNRRTGEHYNSIKMPFVIGFLCVVLFVFHIRLGFVCWLGLDSFVLRFIFFFFFYFQVNRNHDGWGN